MSNVIYSCYYGSYLAAVAAALHLGHLKEFDREKIECLAYFGKVEVDRLGWLYFIGEDEKGRKIYIMGAKKVGKVVERALKGVARIYNMGEEAVVFVDLLPYGNFLFSAGCFLLERLKLKGVGDFFLMMGIKKSFGKLRVLVENIKQSG